MSPTPRRRIPEGRCDVCGTEIAGAGECAQCLADPRRRELVRLCVALMDGSGDRDEQARKAKEIAAGLRPPDVRLLAGAARDAAERAERIRPDEMGKGGG